MISMYEEKKEQFNIVHKVSKHYPPHLHDNLEIVYVTEGTLELGVGQEFFHMEKGDFAIVFPNLIHHYQVFSKECSTAYELYPPLSYVGQFVGNLQKYCPDNPVIKKENVHGDIINAVCCLAREQVRDSIVEQCYIQIIVARSLPCFHLIEKDSLGSGDIIFRTVSYVAAHFREEIKLERMAKDLGVSKYVLSRVFSATFHKNYNQYLNEQRMNYVISLLECSDEPITDICLNAGFQSQRTFNRVFREMYKMSPREYRNYYREKYITQQSL